MIGKHWPAVVLVLGGVSAWAVDVRITPDLPVVEVIHEGKPFTIMRNQDPENLVNSDYAKTSRKCPPFCIRPIRLAPGVETVGELEVINYLQQKSTGDDSIMVIDSRTPDWVAKGTIPGTVNIPWTELTPSAGADPFGMETLLQERFGVHIQEGLWDFSSAKTLILFCNGMWCGQSPRNIKALLKLGYPAHKIKWYRGGMQSWEILGLSTVKPARKPEDR